MTSIYFISEFIIFDVCLINIWYQNSEILPYIFLLFKLNGMYWNDLFLKQCDISDIKTFLSFNAKLDIDLFNYNIKFQTIWYKLLLDDLWNLPEWPHAFQLCGINYFLMTFNFTWISIFLPSIPSVFLMDLIFLTSCIVW